MVWTPFKKFSFEAGVCSGPNKVPFSNGSPIRTCLYTSASWSRKVWYMLSWRICNRRIKIIRKTEYKPQYIQNILKKKRTSLRHVVHRCPAVPTAANNTERTASWISASSITIMALFPLSSRRHLPNLALTCCWTIRPACIGKPVLHILNRSA